MFVKLKERVPFGLRQSVKIMRARIFEAVGSHRFSHPALHDLDRRMLKYLPDSAGVFLEIGANNGYSQSNTYFLERVRGWRGILIEPLPALYEQCRRLRRNSQCFNVACVAPEQDGTTVQIVDLDLMSVTLGQQESADEARRLGTRRATRTIEVHATTISAIVDRAGETGVTFLSLDVEGAELQVLAGLDFARHAPEWLLVETDQIEAVLAKSAPWMELVEQMTHHDYLLRRSVPRALA